MASSTAKDARTVAAETSDDEHKDKDVDDGPVPRSEAEADHSDKQYPKPTMTEETPYGNGIKAKCWWPNCKISRTTCDSLMTHVRSYHGVTNVPADWEETFFVKKARDEKTEQQKKRRDNPKAKPRKRKTKAAGESVLDATGQQDIVTSMASSSALAPLAKESDTTSQMAIRATTVNSGKSTAILKPGTTSSMIYIPTCSFQSLVRDGFLQEIEDGKVGWLDVSAEEQKRALLKALPSGMQSILLAQEFGVSSDIVHAEQGKPLEVKLTVESGAFNVAVASMPPFLRGVFSEVINVMHQMKKFMSGTPFVEMQKLKIKEDRETFEWSEASKKKNRRQFPFKAPQLNYEVLSEFLIARDLKKKSRNIHLQSFDRFVDTFETVDPEAKLDLDNILINVYSSDLFPKLMTLPLFDSQCTFSVKLVKTLGHVAGMAKSVFYKDDQKAREKISQIIEDCLTPWSERCYKAKKERDAKKGAKDAETLSNYHSRETLKGVGFFSYLCLMTIHHHVCKTKDVKLTLSLLFKATSFLVAAVYTNSPPSRSMEIETLLTKVVTKFSSMEPELIALAWSLVVLAI